MDLRVILGNQFFDEGETNNWVLQLENLLVQSDWNLKVDITPCFPVWGSTDAKVFLRKSFFKEKGGDHSPNLPNPKNQKQTFKDTV